MMQEHKVVPSPDVYGLGTFVDVDVLPVPEDARRIFEILARKTPGFTQDRDIWETVKFEGHEESMIPGPLKSPVIASVVHAMIGVVGNELLEIRDGKQAKNGSVMVNTDHAAMWLGTPILAYVNGVNLTTLIKENALKKLFELDMEKEAFMGLAGRATAIYPTKDPKVWYQLHGTFDGTGLLHSMGIETNVHLDSLEDRYDYIRKHVQNWSPDELEMHMVKHGLCGSLCYTPEGWRQTAMGKRLNAHPLINYTHETYAVPTPPIPLPVLEDKRPLAGNKVLEMVRVVSAPTLGVTLASYGADVIRVQCSDLPDLNVRRPFDTKTRLNY
jgi:hypothetical protein